LPIYFRIYDAANHRIYEKKATTEPRDICPAIDSAPCSIDGARRKELPGAAFPSSHSDSVNIETEMEKMGPDKLGTYG
jgi:hypothetical protein